MDISKDTICQHSAVTLQLFEFIVSDQQLLMGSGKSPFNFFN